MTGLHAHPGVRRDAVRNYHRILDAGREVLGESGASASMEDIAARAGVGVGTVYRRFDSKDALIDELLRLALEELIAVTERALERTDGDGLEELLRGLGQSFADHARYANLLLDRPADPAASGRIRAAIDELTARAIAAGTVHPGTTAADVMALIWAMRGLIQTAGEVAPGNWQRFLAIHLAGLRGAHRPRSAQNLRPNGLGYPEPVQPLRPGRLPSLGASRGCGARADRPGLGTDTEPGSGRGVALRQAGGRAAARRAC
jgi:AcrR family transcriptional regulator